MIDVRRPFTRSDALAAGIDAALLRGSRFRRIFRGVYVAAEVVPSPRERVEASLTLFSGPARASHVSAARVYGVPIPAFPDEHVTVTRAEDRRRRPEIRCHVDADPQLVVVHGLPVSTPETMFIELASMLELVDLVVVGDSLVRLGLVTTESLRAAATGTGRDTPPRRCREAAGLVRERVDSPMETRLRLLLVLAGCPEPVVNVAVRSPDGQLLRRYDLSWARSRVVVEYDGRHHVSRESQWQRDIDRRHAIESDGWRVLVITSHGVYRDPAGTIALVLGVLRQRGEPGVPARPDTSWRPHFAA